MYLKPAQPPVWTMILRPSAVWRPAAAFSEAREIAVLIAATALSVSWIMGASVEGADGAIRSTRRAKL